MKKPTLPTIACFLFSFCAAVSLRSGGTDTYTKLVDFDGIDNGVAPYMSLVQGLDGNLYGTTSAGGTYNGGTVFKITPSGTLTTIYSFCLLSGCADGAIPLAGLVLATNGNFYGTTQEGGANGAGTVFKITAGGTLTTLYSFCSQSNCADGTVPNAGLVQATNGDFYGTTLAGGNLLCGGFGCGTVFKITPGGTLATIYSFCSQSNCTDGVDPYAGLVLATNGDFYGTTEFGGANCTLRGGCGTVFRITPSGTLTTLYSFCPQGGGCADGSTPLAGLIQASNGSIYGTTSGGGDANDGTVFKITLSGTFTRFYSFCSQANCADGAVPYYGGLIQATDGNFYGTTLDGGANNNSGTIFQLTPGGTLTTLYNFCSQINAQNVCTDGYYAAEGLVQDTSGKFYGSTAHGGANDDGTIFSLSVGLGPFVQTLPTSGKVGATVYILGTNLTGASNVSFGGTSAAFTVVSATKIKTSVPGNALTGAVTVTTPSGKLKSNKKFRVIPQITSFTPPSGPPTTVVTITGVSLKQTTKVSFGGVAATTFTVVNDTTVKATVPSGAVTGHIKITTPGGTATSSGVFTVS